MRKVYSIADNIVSPLGMESSANWDNILKGVTGVKANNKPNITLKNFYASLLEENDVDEALNGYIEANIYTKLEKMFILSISRAVKQCEVDLTSSSTLFIFSSTKGNIDILDRTARTILLEERANLMTMTKSVAGFFRNPNKPIVISNACVSGVLAIIIGSYYIKEGLYNKVIVTGGDIISEFTISGFNSLQALSQGNCRPFDKNRDGVNLGEACATVILSATTQSNLFDIEIMGGATSDDANHISGPSRTGDGLQLAINNALLYSRMTSSDIGYISAHGTATVYNDEMEAKAFNSCRLSEVPVNSFKGYFGHTLGAAGVLETILAMWSVREQKIVASKGYNEHGASLPLQVVKENKEVSFTNCMKTASGFGGCNAALILSKK